MADATIEVEARLKDFMTKNFNKIEGQLKDFGAAADKNFKKADKAAGGFLQTMKGFVGAQAIISSFRMMTRGLGKLADSFIDANAEAESLGVQFEVLLGSTEAARARMEELSVFAATTPFELTEIAQASKLLQQFGGDLLATGDSLRMVGDMAASTATKDFAGVAMWVGRAYSAIQSGRPFGEAAQRLLELGLLSGQARNRLEGLIASGADATTIWNQFRKEMEQFNGMMIRQSRTWEGLMSTMRDAIQMILRDIGAGGLFTVMREGLASVVDWFGRNIKAIKNFAFAIGTELGAALATGRELLFSFIESMVGTTVTSLDSADAMKMLRSVMQTIFKGIAVGITVFRTLGNILEILARFIVSVLVTAIANLKVQFDLVVTSAKTFGRIVKAIVKGEFKTIPDIIKDGFEKGKQSIVDNAFAVKEVWKDFGLSAKEDIVDIANAWTFLDETFNSTADNYEANLNRLRTAFEALRQKQKQTTDDNNDNTKKEVKYWNTKYDAASNFFSGLSNLSQQGAKQSKALGEIAKAAAIADATINTYKAANQALADNMTPLPFKIIGMIGIIATGLANVAKIQAQSFQRGGIAAGGAALVGEAGPELVNLPRGASITSAQQTQKIIENNTTTNNMTRPVVVVVDRNEDFASAIQRATRDGSIDWARIATDAGLQLA